MHAGSQRHARTYHGGEEGGAGQEGGGDSELHGRWLEERVDAVCCAWYVGYRTRRMSVCLCVVDVRQEVGRWTANQTGLDRWWSRHKGQA